MNKLLSQPGFKTIFACVAGSHLYGTNTTTGDEDIRAPLPNKPNADAADKLCIKLVQEHIFMSDCGT